MGKRIPKPTSAHRRQWEQSISRSKCGDVDPESIFDTAQVSDDSDSGPDLSAQEIRRRRYARKQAPMGNDEDHFEKIDRAQLDRLRDDAQEKSPLRNSEEEADSDDDGEEPLLSQDDVIGSSLGQKIPVLASNDDAIKALAELEQEDTNFLLGASRSNEQDAGKAAAVQQQRKLFDSALDLRMSLQKPLQISGRFPYGEGYEIVCSQSAEVADKFQEAAHTLSAALADLTSLESRLLNASGLFGSIEPKPISQKKQKKRGRPDLDAIWNEIDARFQATQNGRESAIDYWNRRTQVAAGKKFKALNQSVLVQIRASLADMEPLRKRAFTNKNQVAVLAYDQAAEIFDDTDFYHMLLKDLIDSSGNEMAASGRISRRSADPASKVVDRRASKGRKIRFEVHEKIVNFMAPCTPEDSLDFDIDHLFTHLFAT